jgi:hypothetical protein
MKLAYSPNIENKIIYFHGINEANYLKKGNAYFEDALKIIENKYQKMRTHYRQKCSLTQPTLTFTIKVILYLIRSLVTIRVTMP